MVHFQIDGHYLELTYMYFTMFHSYVEALKDVHNGLNHVMRGRSISVLNYPGLDEVIEESNPHIIEVSSTF